jgi:hypothetical protein
MTEGLAAGELNVTLTSSGFQGNVSVSTFLPTHLAHIATLELFHCQIFRPPVPGVKALYRITVQLGFRSLCKHPLSTLAQIAHYAPHSSATAFLSSS